MEIKTRQPGKSELKNSLFKEAFTLNETQCFIISDKQEGIKTAIASIKRSRQHLETYIEGHPNFSYTLKPYPPPKEPLVAKIMAEAAEKAGVGPMAAVAGAIADLAVNDMIAAGCRVAVVEDGGEISAVSNCTIDVAVGVGDEPLSRKFGFRLFEFPIGVATSSGRFSHALSFGDAEAAIIFSKNAAMADAAATAVGNVVKGEVDVGIDVGIERALSIEGVEGVFILYKGKVGIAGKVPKIIKVERSP